MIQLQFVCERALTSNAIAWFSSGHFSHVDAITMGGQLLGARSDFASGGPAGVQVRPPNYAAFNTRVVFDIPAMPLQKRRFDTYLKYQIGKPYDREAIWAFMFNRNWREQDSWICSELQAAALEHAGVLPPLYLAANKITPVALALAISAVGAKPTTF